MDLANINIQMVQFILGSLNKVKGMGMDNFEIKQEIDIGDNLKMVIGMARGKSIFLININMKVTLNKEKCMGQAKLYLLMEALMKGISKMGNGVAKENIQIKIKRVTI